MKPRTALIAMALSLAAATAQAAIIFDFESTPATFTTPPDSTRTGALTSLVLSNAGLTMTIGRGRGFDIVSNTGNQVGKPAGWGERSLDPFVLTVGGTPFVIDFSSAITAFSVEFGDYAGDVPDVLSLMAYSGPGGTGTLLASASVSLDPQPNSFNFTTGSVAANGISSIVMIGGSTAFPHSVFYDNISVTQVPEPGTIALLGLGLAGLAATRRRKQ